MLGGPNVVQQNLGMEIQVSPFSRYSSKNVRYPSGVRKGHMDPFKSVRGCIGQREKVHLGGSFQLIRVLSLDNIGL